MRTPSPIKDALGDNEDVFDVDGLSTDQETIMELREASLEDKTRIDHLESKIEILENRQEMLIRALETMELLPVHPHARMEAVNNRATLLMDNI